MDWKTLKDKVYFEDGSYRDLLISGTSVDDWRNWVDYVTTHYKTSTKEHDSGNVLEGIDFKNVQDYWAGKNDGVATTSVHVGNVIVNAHYFGHDEIENDITPVEVKTMDDHLGIIKFMTDLSKLLSKKVIMTLENSPDIVLLTVDRDTVKIPET